MSVTIALAGNPNSGKTTMFNALTGSAQYVGNWPGVTVEKKEGTLRSNKDIRVVDLPGTYSLSPYSPEEIVSRDYLLSGDPGAVLDLVDSTNIERNLYLTLQMLELGLPVVVALNMTDLVRKNGDSINVGKLSQMLGCQVVETTALKNDGTQAAALAAAELAKPGTPVPEGQPFSPEVESVLGAILLAVSGKIPAGKERWYSVKLFERDASAIKELSLSPAQIDAVEALIAPVENVLDDDSESIITAQRYQRITEIVAACVKKKKRAETTSDKIDRIVTNRFLALPIFAAIMFLVYFLSIKSVGEFVTDWTNDVLFGDIIGGGVAAFLKNLGASAWVVSLFEEGIIAGVGAVLGFIPQMIILFFLLSFLEDCGYMARVAFIMDRIFRKFGLSGKSFIPMLISSGCAVPGIMATKTIENEKDRRMTIITTSFIPCGAKLPIISLLTGSIMGGAWWVSPVIYFVGVAAIIVSGIILKKTRLFAGETAPFVMELPQYHMPSGKGLVLHVWERVRSFIVKAGTVIFISSIIIWALLSLGFEGGSFGMVEEVDHSLMAGLGSLFAVLFAPLGFGNWQASVGVIAGLVAKENLVSALAIIHGLSGDIFEGILDDSQPLWAFMNMILPSMAAGMSFLIFNMLCAPCFAAIGSIRRQMNNFKWTAFAVAYQCVFAYCISLMVYQFGTFLAGGPFTVGTGAALVVLIAFCYLLFRPDPQRRMRLRSASATN